MNCNRKDFERLGKLFKKHRNGGLPQPAIEALARDFATLLEENNGNFNRAKFLESCGCLLSPKVNCLVPSENVGVKSHETANGNGTPVNGDCTSRNCYAA